MTTTRKPVTRTARLVRAMKSPTARTWSHRLPALAVFGVAAWVSYGHTVDVAVMGHQTPVTSHILAFATDGLMVVAARYIGSAQVWYSRMIAWLSFAAGMGATLGVNLLAAGPTGVDQAVSVWPAAAMTLTGLMLHFGDAKPKRRPIARKTSTKATTPAKLTAVS